VGEDVNAAVFAEAKDLAFGTQIPRGRVEEGVVFEGAGGFEVEAEVRETGLKSLGIGDGEL
jgi:hypothetical protein